MARTVSQQVIDGQVYMIMDKAAHDKIQMAGSAIDLVGNELNYVFPEWEQGDINSGEENASSFAIRTGFINIENIWTALSNIKTGYRYVLWFYIDLDNYFGSIGPNEGEYVWSRRGPNANYLRISMYYPGKTQEITPDAGKDFYIKLGEKQNSKFEFSASSWYTKAKTPLARVSGVKRFENNLFDPAKISDGCYIQYTNGTTVDNSGYFCSSYIPVTSGVKYRSNKGRNIAWYNSLMEYISGESGTGIQFGVIAPTNAAYLRMTINKTTDTPDPYNVYVADDANYNDTTVIDGLFWTNGKRINWIGDSIVDGQDFDEEVCAAIGLIKENEYGINGSTIALKADGTDGRNALCERYSLMSDDADIIAVSCGTNDFEYAWCPIGTIDDADDGSSNTTFYGALKALCKGLINKYPQKVIFFTTPIKRAQPFADGAGGTYTPDGVMTTPFSKNKYGKTLGDYADIIKEVCGYYSIPVLDMYRESLLNPHLASQQNMFDNVLTHPNTTAQKIMARRVCGWIAQLGYSISGLN